MRTPLLRFVAFSTALLVLLPTTTLAQNRELEADSGGDEYSVSVPLPDRECQGVPVTGQTTCWDTAGIQINCEGTGQDGEYQYGFTPGAFTRFIDHFDGTVTDNLTGLIWLQDALCFGGLNWQATLDAANGLDDGQCGLTDGSVAGDWRLPNIRELHSLIDFGQSGPALPPGHPFPEFNGIYWSSTSKDIAPHRAWIFISASGDCSTPNKISSFRAWPVRGGQ
jgi:hypothetical protein